MGEIKLRPYQAESAEEIRGAFLQGIRSVLLVAPTSAGKTILFSHVARGAAARGNRVLILAHRDFLIKQASAKLSDVGVSHGIIMGDYSPTPHAMVQVGSVQTMVRRIRKQSYNFQLIVVDECLHGDSIIDTDVGRIKISDVPVKNPKYVLSSDGASIIYKKILGFKRTEDRATMRVRHSSGDVVCTPDHLFLTESGWKKAKNLSLLDRLFVPADAGNQYLPINGDMSASGSRDIGFGNASQLIGNLGLMPCSQPHPYVNADAEDELDCYGRPLIVFEKATQKLLDTIDSFSDINVDPKTGYIKSQSVNIRRFLERFSAIRALFSPMRRRQILASHGTMGQIKPIGRSTKPNFFPAFMSRRKSGKIPGSVTPVFVAARRAYQHSSRFMNWSLEMASKLLVMNGSIVSAMLDSRGGFAMMDQEIRKEIIAYSISKDTTCNPRRSSFHGSMPNSTAQHCSKPVNIESLGLQSQLPHDYMQSSGNMFRTSSATKWSPIVGIKEDLVCDVFDIEVEDTHCFFANDVLVHNCHLSAAKTYLDIIDHFPKSRILGVTGSPCRLDGRGLGSTAGGRFDHMIESVTTRELIDDGYAVQPIVYAPLNRLDLSKVKKKGADYDKAQLSSVMNTRVITGNAIDHYREHAMHVPACTWCVDVDHARTTAAEFNAAGIKSVMIYGKSTGEERDRAMRQLADGTISNVTFCQLLVEGVDCPAIGCIIGLRPTYSLAGYLQTNGRMLRVMYAPGYDLSTREGRFAAIDAGPKGRKGIFLDCAGLTFRHGFIDEIREWSLLGAPTKPKETEMVVAIRQCPICMIVFPPAPVCPGCGYVFEIRSREIEREDGRLDELTPEMLAGIAAKKRIDVGRADTREELEAIAKARNYSPAWVNVQLRIKAGKKAAAEVKASQKQLWLEEQAKVAARTNPKFKFDWPEV